jgi:hypothetical protein
VSGDEKKKKVEGKLIAVSCHDLSEEEKLTLI